MSSNPAKGPLVDAEPVRQHVLALKAAGVSNRVTAAAAGLSLTLVDGLIYSLGGHPPRLTMRQANAERILAVRPADVVPGITSAMGTRRRLHALVAVGWPLSRLGAHLGMHASGPGHLVLNHWVFGRTAHTVAVAYTRLWNADPLANGVPVGSVKRARNHALASGWAPPAAWDDTALDDPAAHPEWTGYCGSRRGWQLHQTNGLPICERCAAYAPESSDYGQAEGRDELAAYRRREIEHLAAYGVSEQDIAERLGMAPAYVHDLIRDMRKAAA